MPLAPPATAFPAHAETPAKATPLFPPPDRACPSLPAPPATRRNRFLACGAPASMRPATNAPPPSSNTSAASESPPARRCASAEKPLALRPPHRRERQASGTQDRTTPAAVHRIQEADPPFNQSAARSPLVAAASASIAPFP